MTETATSDVQAGVSGSRAPVRISGRNAGLTGRVLLSFLPVGVLLVAFLWIVLPALFTWYSPVVGSNSRLVAPGAEHWFGTDQLGRDIYTRFVFGTRVTFLTAGIAVVVGFVFGTFVGLLTATLPSVFETIGMRMTDVLISVPSFLIAILIATSFGRGSVQVGVGVGFGSIALFARVSRAEILKVSQYDFVQASYLSGSRYPRVVLTRILPNSIGAVISLAVVELAAVIIVIAGLGYLGFGAPPPTPEWGLIIAEGRDYLRTGWWISILPSIAITVVVLSIGVLGRWLSYRLRF